MKNILIVYYSRRGENYCSGKILNLSKGNTEIAAEFIKEATGGDLFAVETVTPYSDNYTECTKQAAKEMRAGARPEIKGYVDDISKYDTIFVGFPNWCGTMPMAMFTFLEHYDLAGKTIVPFCTNEGSGVGRSEHDLKKICKGAAIAKGYSIKGTKTSELKDEIEKWAKVYA